MDTVETSLALPDLSPRRNPRARRFECQSTGGHLWLSPGAKVDSQGLSQVPAIPLLQ